WPPTKPAMLSRRTANTTSASTARTARSAEGSRRATRSPTSPLGPIARNCHGGATPSGRRNEIFCDVFAAELLLPYKLFKPLVDKADISLTTVDHLACRFVASNVATGSRFATLASAPCAFVLSERGKVRYASRSTLLRQANAWIPPRTILPQGSLSER